ncbi:UNVERIFIED_ORG: hypothetical protein M2328_005759 [Rhodococcus erythropolis]
MQLSLVLGILLVVAVAAIIIVMAELDGQGCRKKQTAPTVPTHDPVEMNRYGHRFAPVREIRRQLPKLGDRHVWESWVDTRSGEPVFHLQLLATGVDDVVVASLARNFARDGVPFKYSQETWAETYSNGMQSYYTGDARAALVGHVVEWAKVQANVLYGDVVDHAIQR